MSEKDISNDIEVNLQFNEKEISKGTVFEQATELNKDMQDLVFDSPYSIRRQYQEAVDALNENAAIANLLGKRVEMYGEKIYIPDVEYMEDGSVVLSHIIAARSDEYLGENFIKGDFSGFGLQITPVYENEDEYEGEGGSLDSTGCHARVCVRVGEDDIDVTGFEGVQFSYGVIDEVRVDFAEDVLSLERKHINEKLLSVKSERSAQCIEEMKGCFSDIFDEDDQIDVEKLQNIGHLAKKLLRIEGTSSTVDLKRVLSDWFENELFLKGSYIETISFTAATLQPIVSGEIECAFKRSKHINTVEVEGAALDVAFIPSDCGENKLYSYSEVEVLADTPCMAIEFFDAKNEYPNIDSTEKHKIVYIPLEAVAGIDVQIEA